MSQIYSHVGYCRCGCEVWVEYIFSGGNWMHRFSDQNFKEITCCPDCGKELHEDDLESK